MTEYAFKQVDFEKPSLLFIIEDVLKNAIGSLFLYHPYFKTFNLRGDEKVLDFGCGGGAGSRSLLQHLNKGGHLTCIDCSEYWIRRAAERLKRYPNVTCCVGEIAMLDIADSSFDVISVIHVLHDIAPENRQGTAHALSKKLKQGGILYMREPTKQSHGISVEELRSLTSNAGLNEIKYSLIKWEYLGTFQRA